MFRNVGGARASRCDGSGGPEASGPGAAGISAAVSAVGVRGRLGEDRLGEDRLAAVAAVEDHVEGGAVQDELAEESEL